jgi:hypothetical protein
MYFFQILNNGRNRWLRYVLFYSNDSIICKNYKTIKFLKAYTAVVAHEIGHSLGLYHDGDKSPDDLYSKCNASYGNIMAPSSRPVSEYNQYINKFSNCSINGFKANLLSSNLKTILPYAKCLTNTLNENEFQVWNAYNECKLLFGNNSIYCLVK